MSEISETKDMREVREGSEVPEVPEKDEIENEFDNEFDDVISEDSTSTFQFEANPINETKEENKNDEINSNENADKMSSQYESEISQKENVEKHVKPEPASQESGSSADNLGKASTDEYIDDVVKEFENTLEDDPEPDGKPEAVEKDKEIAEEPEPLGKEEEEPVGESEPVEVELVEEPGPVESEVVESKEEPVEVPEAVEVEDVADEVVEDHEAGEDTELMEADGDVTDKTSDVEAEDATDEVVEDHETDEDIEPTEADGVTTGVSEDKATDKTSDTETEDAKGVESDEITDEVAEDNKSIEIPEPVEDGDTTEETGDKKTDQTSDVETEGAKEVNPEKATDEVLEDGETEDAGDKVIDQTSDVETEDGKGTESDETSGEGVEYDTEEAKDKTTHEASDVEAEDNKSVETPEPVEDGDTTEETGDKNTDQTSDVETEEAGDKVIDQTSDVETEDGKGTESDETSGEEVEYDTEEASDTVEEDSDTTEEAKDKTTDQASDVEAEDVKGIESAEATDEVLEEDETEEDTEPTEADSDTTEEIEDRTTDQTSDVEKEDTKEIDPEETTNEVMEDDGNKEASEPMKAEDDKTEEPEETGDKTTDQASDVDSEETTIEVSKHDEPNKSTEDMKNIYFENASYEQGKNDYGYMGTCGPTSIANSLNRITGTSDFTENGVLSDAVESNLCHVSTDPHSCGGTGTSQVVELIDKVKGVESNIHTEVYEYDKALSVKELADRLKEEGTVAIVGVDSAVLWDQRGDVSNSGLFQISDYSDHWITVDSPTWDEAENLTGFNVIDSGGGVDFVDKDKFEKIYLGDESHTIKDPTSIIISKSDVRDIYNGGYDINKSSDYKGNVMLSDQLNPMTTREISQLNEMCDKFGRDSFSEDKSYDANVDKEFCDLKNKNVINTVEPGTSESDIKREIKGEVYSEEERNRLISARNEIDEVSPIDENTIMQKVVGVDTGNIEKDLGNFLNPRDRDTGEIVPAKIYGFVSKAEDATPFTKTPRECYENLRLDYKNTPYDGERPVYVIRYTGEAEKYSVPYSKEFGGERTDPQPFAGNGYTGSETKVIPEYTTNGTMPSQGVIYRVDSAGNETAVAYYSEKDHSFELIK